MSDLSDVGHWFGGDLLLSPTGDLALVQSVDRSRQRVLRRVMTAEGDYIAHPDYGAGLPGEIGENLDLNRLRGIVRSQMVVEASVESDPEPTVRLTAIQNGVTMLISYNVAPEQRPAVLSVDVEKPDGA